MNPNPQDWLRLDPDPDTRAELQALLGADDEDALAERFGKRLQFGTAGLRGALGAGPNRMNRLVVRAAAAGLARYLLDTVPDAGAHGVVIGFDARHKSAVFALDSARVFAAAGLAVHLFPTVVPTPTLAFAITHLGVAAGVQVTASHNPPADNGYKVYLGDGAQIVPPADTEIATRIDAVFADLGALELARHDDPRIRFVEPSVEAAYRTGALALDPHVSNAAERARLRIVHTAMHGVGHASATALLGEAGFTDVRPVAEQAVPDPDFPTIAFPNPEEPGALDLALDLARRTGADLVLANDPDADRMAAAVADPSVPGGWRMLRGDEVGWLLAEHLLRTRRPGDPNRMLATTIVSSSLLRAMAAAHGVVYIETLTGFKWLARAALDRPGLTLVLAYEEALGYCVGDQVRDKDGLSAAVVFADLAAHVKGQGSTLLNELRRIADRYGDHQTTQWSIRFDGADAGERMTALMTRARAQPPTVLGGATVTGVRDLADADPPADVLVLSLGDAGRVVIRPSGTEPKCKIYIEAVGGKVEPEAVRRDIAAALGIE